MALTSTEFRKLALGLPETEEGSHMGHADFRVRNKIFATLTADESRAMVKLTPDQQRILCASEPDLFAAVPGGWGKGGATHLLLARADKAAAKSALKMAWQNTVAPKAKAMPPRKSSGIKRGL